MKLPASLDGVQTHGVAGCDSSVCCPEVRWGCRAPERNLYNYTGFPGARVIKTEKAMAPHSSTLAWKIPWTEEPGGLQSMGSQRVGHD